MRVPGDDQKITNADEQAVAVNSSTTDDGGYDEPINRIEPADEKAGDAAKSSKTEDEKKKTPPPPHHTKAK
jgi:hypothetical protein